MKLNRVRRGTARDFVTGQVSKVDGKKAVGSGGIAATSSYSRDHSLKNAARTGSVAIGQSVAEDLLRNRERSPISQSSPRPIIMTSPRPRPDFSHALYEGRQRSIPDLRPQSGSGSGSGSRTGSARRRG